MSERNPILITGAAGEIGGVSRMMVDMLLGQGHPVRAFVRQDDERAQSLRQAGGTSRNRGQLSRNMSRGGCVNRGPSRYPAVAGSPHVDPKGRCRVGVPRPSVQSGGGHDGSIRS